MDEKTKQMVRDNLQMMKEKWAEKMEKAGMDDQKMEEMKEKAIKMADEMGMDAKDTIMMGKMLKMVGKAMMKEDEMEDDD